MAISINDITMTSPYYYMALHYQPGPGALGLISEDVLFLRMYICMYI